MNPDIEAFFSPEELAKREQLQLLRTNLAARTYPGYPEQEQRLFGNPDFCIDEYGHINLPRGSWVIDNHPNQHHPEDHPDYETTRQLRHMDVEIDAHGRPLHPWFRDMMRDPSIGIVLGKGAYWHWGPNYTADSVILCQDHVLLVKRKDTGLWALPGGHVDPGEAALTAAVREAAEETGLILPNTVSGTVVYEGPVVDLRVTANAWPETTAVLYTLEQDLPSVQGMDDAADAAWVPLEVMQQEGILFGSHRFLLSQAVAMYRQQK